MGRKALQEKFPSYKEKMQEQATLKILLGEFYEKLKRLDDLVHRNAVFPHAPGKIKVAIGMRRSGKTYFIYQNVLRLLEEGIAQSSILYINFEDDRLLPLNHAKLIEAFYSLYPENHDKKCYLFLDEIQNVENWPLLVRRLHDSKNVEIFLTGSSAKLLSKEIATSLRGRALSVEIWPFSFTEFMRAKKNKIDCSLYDKKTQDKLMQLFHFYLSEGGFPEVVSLSQDIRQKILQEYIDLVVYRDIIERHQISNPSIVKYMILSMLHNAGRPFSVNKFYNDLKSQGHAIGKDSLYAYADHIEDAYLAFSVPVYDRSLRKSYILPKKLYAVDPGMVRALTLDYENDLGRLFENIVYLDLKRLGYKVNYYLTSEGYEVDFLVHTARGQKKLFQVVWNVQDSGTFARKERALAAGMKELKTEGEIITLDTYLQQGENSHYSL